MAMIHGRSQVACKGSATRHSPARRAQQTPRPVERPPRHVCAPSSSRGTADRIRSASTGSGEGRSRCLSWRRAVSPQTTPTGPSLFDAPGLSERSVDATAPLAVRMCPGTSRSRRQGGPRGPRIAPVLWLIHRVRRGLRDPRLRPGPERTTIASCSAVPRAAFRRAQRRHGRGQGRAGRHRHRPDVRRADRAVHRRGRPVHPHPAGRPAARGGERWATLVAATTRTRASRWSPRSPGPWPLTLTSLTDEQVGELLDLAVLDPRGLAGRGRALGWARADLIRYSGGDARRALTYLEAAAEGVAGAASRAGSR